MPRTDHADDRLSRRKFLVGAAGLAGVAVLPAWPGSSHAASATPFVSSHSSDVAVRWVETMYDLVLLENLSPPAAARTYAHGAIAMYEAVVAGMPGHNPLGPQLNGRPRTVHPRHRGQVDWPTALAVAVVDVLGHVLPFRADETRSRLDDALGTELAARRAAGVAEAAIAAGSSHGRAVARELIRWIAADGHAQIVGRPYDPPTGQPYLWESTPPNFRPAIEPYWHDVRPLVLHTADEIVPPPHIPFDPNPDSPFGQQAMTTYQQSFQNTDEQRAIARFWTDNPGSFTPPFGTPTGLPSGHWMLIGAQGIRVRGVALDRAVETFALVGIALHEAFLNCWTWKYRFNLLRPVTYVRRYIDPDWSTFINTPQFPEYTSGHSVASPAAAATLTAQLGAFPFTDDSHAPRGMPARSFTSFQHAAQEAAQSRLYGGIHFPMGIEAGLSQGEKVGAAVLARVRTRRRR